MAPSLKPFYLGRILGIPIRAHYSWLPVFPFYTWVISSVYLPGQAPGRSSLQYWTLGFITTVLLFASVLVHELAHSLMARAEGIGTASITLYLFGGLASLGGQPARPSSEFKIAVAGPAASFLVGTIFFAADELLLFGTTYLAPAKVLRHLGIVNWFLAGFNILPGLPLDGGRILRAALWHINKSFRAATRIAVRAGMTIAFALLLGGAYLFLSKDAFGYLAGLWSLSIGLILLLLLLTSEGLAPAAVHAKKGTVAQVMARDVIVISPETRISEFVDTILRNNRQTSFAIGVERKLHGMLLLEELKSVDETDWKRLAVGEVMRPVDETMFVSSAASPDEAQRKLATGRERLVVLDASGLIVGQVSAAELMRLKRT